MFALVPVDTFGYKLMLLLHILSVIVAFAPAFVWPVASARLKKEGKPVGPTIGMLAAGNTAKIHGPALVLIGFFGFGLVGMSDKLFKFDQSWVMAAIVIWFMMLAIIFGWMLPAEKKAAAGDEAADKMVAMAGGIMHLLLLVMLFLMIWKPGFP